jgi:Alpha amylase, catalytic domain
MIRTNTILLIATLLATNATLSAQNVMMQGWYWDYPKGAWADTLAAKATGLAAAGFTSVWFPPHAAAGSGPFSNGYDPKDLFIGTAMTGLGNLAQISNMTTALTNAGIDPVADMIYNHRDGGRAEVNTSVEGWIESYNSTKVAAGDLPYPSDRYHCILPIGGSTGNGAGDYYFKIKSASGHVNFHNDAYKVYAQTNKKGWQNQADINETEPNAGGGCGEPSNAFSLGRNFLANIDGLGCGVDEYKLVLGAADFNATDTIYLYINNTAAGGISDYSDHFIYEIWYNGSNIQPQLKYRTWTDHGAHSSGRGQMTSANFRPNGNPTTLNGDKDGMWFFYDYDHSVPSTRDTLNAWTLWNWDYLKVRGVRMDAVKHFDASYVTNMLSHMSGQGKNFDVVVGEIYSTDISEYQAWLSGVGNAAARVFDFSLRDNLRQACDEGGYDVRNVFESAAADNGINPYQVVTFVNNHDFRDGSGFASLAKNEYELAYAYILTNNQIGLPCVYYPDYYGYPSNGYSYYPTNLAGRKATIDSLMDTHLAYCVGASDAYYLNDFAAPLATYTSGVPSKALIYQLEKGSSDPLIAINFDNFPLTVSINLAGIPSGTTFSKVGGAATATNTFVTSGLQATFTVPARSYAVWLQGLVLPVELLAFEATLQANETVALDWQFVDAPQQQEEFAVERSTDGVLFEQIGTAPYHESATMQYIDTQLPIGAQTLYYRLAIKELDGQISRSVVRTVRREPSGIKMQVYPNPGTAASSKINLSGIKYGHQLTLTLSSLDGRLIAQMPVNDLLPNQSIDLPKMGGTKQIVINLHDLHGQLSTCILFLAE